MSTREVFSERLRALRKEIGISQDHFARELGVARATLGYYEKGERLPDIAFLDLVCEKTGCSVEYLMGYSDNMDPLNYEFGLTTGLSDKAIAVLTDTNVYFPIDILNFFIEHPRFKELLRTMKILSVCSDAHSGCLSPEDSFREYKHYQASSIIREICQEAHRDPNLGKDCLSSKLQENLKAYAELSILYEQVVLQSYSAAGEAALDSSKARENKRLKDRIEKEEREQAMHDPVLHFYRRMTKARPIKEKRKEE